MIIYFSATGNCKYVAKRIAEETGDTVVSMLDCVENNQKEIRDSVIGIISPTYDYTLPVITRDFLSNTKLEADYLFYVSTYGTSPGGTGRHAAKQLGKDFSAYFSVRMADTWTPTYDLSTPEKVEKFTKSTEDEIESVVAHVRNRDHGQFMDHRAPALLAAIGKLLYENTRKTKHLYVGDNCIGCGLCARKCPVNAIEMKGLKPCLGANPGHSRQVSIRTGISQSVLKKYSIIKEGGRATSSTSVSQSSPKNVQYDYNNWITKIQRYEKHMVVYLYYFV